MGSPWPFTWEPNTTFRHLQQSFHQECQTFIFGSHCYRWWKNEFYMLTGSSYHKIWNLANIKTRRSIYICLKEVLAILLMLLKMSKLFGFCYLVPSLKATRKWKDRHCSCLLTATWIDKYCITLKVPCFGNDNGNISRFPLRKLLVFIDQAASSIFSRNS